MLVFAVCFREVGSPFASLKLTGGYSVFVIQLTHNFSILQLLSIPFLPSFVPWVPTIADSLFVFLVVFANRTLGLGFGDSLQSLG